MNEHHIKTSAQFIDMVVKAVRSSEPETNMFFDLDTLLQNTDSQVPNLNQFRNRHENTRSR